MGKNQTDIELILIGGSWGGLDVVISILNEIPANYPIPFLIVLHRLRNFNSELDKILQKRTPLTVREIEDKDVIRKGTVYLVPADYHVLIEKDKTFSLCTSERVNHSRPSIDVTFESAAEVFRDKVIGIIISGANKDGSYGLKQIEEKGGKTIIQNPSEAEINTMPLSALKTVPLSLSLRLNELKDYLLSIRT